jgi:serpin B
MKPMTRRQFLGALPLSAAMAGCLALDPRWTAAPLAAAAWSQSATAFAFDLFAQLRKQPGNVVFSPLCVSTSLALAAAGASGETRDEINRTLHWTGDPDALPQAVNMQQRQLAAGLAASGCELRIGCGVWVDKSVQVAKEFRSIAENQFGGALQTTAFANNDVAVTAINSWAEAQTGFKVKELAAAGAVRPDARALSTSAGYFKGAWGPRMFPPAASSYGPFNLADGGKTTAYYLRQTAWTPFAQTDAWQAIELPHAGGVLRMLAILPATPGGLSVVEAGLSSEFFGQVIDQMKSEFVSVALPRFKIAGSYSLAAALSSLGVERAFRTGDADFSRLSSQSAICLSGAMHKAVFEVAGGGPAQNTIARGAAPAKGDAEPEAHILALDRPFLVAVRDAASGTVLMLGRVEKP